MKKISLFLLFALLFAACDKIDESQYIVYSGAAGEWNDGTGVDDHSQRAIIEKYTGVRCFNCPNGDIAISSALTQYNGRLLAVSIHDSNFAFTRPYGNSADLRTPDGHAWSRYFGVFDAGQYPMALVNRTPSGNGWDLFNPISGINSHVDPILNSAAKVAIQVHSTLAQGEISSIVNLEFLQTVGDKLNLTLLIIEDSIVATQLMPDAETRNENYIHNHILRDVITDIWGAEVDCTGAAGEKRMALFSFGELDDKWNLDNCHIVAILSNRDTRQVVNVAECEIDK